MAWPRQVWCRPTRLHLIKMARPPRLRKLRSGALRLQVGRTTGAAGVVDVVRMMVRGTMSATTMVEAERTMVRITMRAMTMAGADAVPMTAPTTMWAMTMAGAGVALMTARTMTRAMIMVGMAMTALATMIDRPGVAMTPGSGKLAAAPALTRAGALLIG